MVEMVYRYFSPLTLPQPNLPRHQLSLRPAQATMFKPFCLLKFLHLSRIYHGFNVNNCIYMNEWVILGLMKYSTLPVPVISVILCVVLGLVKSLFAMLVV
jgi:hypothetical protein